MGKNLSRFIIVGLSCVIALSVYDRLDRFLAISGALTCIPVAFLIPAGLHYEVIAKAKNDKKAKIIDVTIIVITGFFMVYCTTVAILTFND